MIRTMAIIVCIYMAADSRAAVSLILVYIAIAALDTNTWNM